MLYLYTAVTAVIVLLIISNTKLSVTKRALTFNDLPKEFDGFKIAQLSDLHSKVFGKKNDILIDKVQKLKPDIIVCTGDMIDKYKIDIWLFICFDRATAHDLSRVSHNRQPRNHDR